MNVVNMNYLDIQNRLREFIKQGVSIPSNGMGPEEVSLLIDLIGFQNLSYENMNNYIDQKQKALITLRDKEGLIPVNLRREWISHQYVQGNPWGFTSQYAAPFQNQQPNPVSPMNICNREIMNNIFDQSEPPASPQNFVDKNSISYKMKDVLTYNDYVFLSNLKITDITNKGDITKTIKLLQKLIDEKVFDEPTFENACSIFDTISISDDIKNEAAGYTMKVIIDGDDDSSARFAMVDADNNEVDVPGQVLPDSTNISVNRDLDKAYGDGMVPYDIIRRY